MDREELVDKLNAIRKQENEIRKQLNELDYEKNLNNLRKYEGKYYKELDNYESSVSCLFVYGIDENCRLMALNISYWKDNEKSFFEISYYSHFNIEDDEVKCRWIEITKEEYMEHYQEVVKRISFALSVKTDL